MSEIDSVNLDDGNAGQLPLPSLVLHLLDMMDDTLMVFDRQWRFVYLNRQALHETGQDAADLLGRALWEKYPGLLGTEVEARYRKAMAEQVSTHFEFQSILTGRWFEVHAHPSPEALLVYGRAITERKRAEDALRQSEEYHRLISELTTDYAYAAQVGPDGSVTIQSATKGFERITGFTVEELEARGGWRTLIHPEDLPTALAKMPRLLAGQMDVNELRIVACNGQTRWIRYTTHPTWDAEQGRVVRLVGAAQDITEAKEAEEKLREYARHMQSLSRRLLEAQEAERRRLAGELHDEIGQVLTAVHLSVQMVRTQCDSEAAPYLDEASAVVARAIGQVRQLSLDLRPSMLDDLGLATALRWYANRLTTAAGLALEFEDGVGGPRLPAAVETAGFRVGQEALTNIARHAQARQVWVELRQEDGLFCLMVRDDGVGFDVAQARKRAAHGGSYGLLGMQERVDLLGGRFEIESAPGRGTVVRAWFRLDAPGT
jgi:PAS domain S-box-containing protein